MNKREFIKQYTNINGIAPTNDQIQEAIDEKRIDTKFHLWKLPFFSSIKNFFIGLLTLLGILAIIFGVFKFWYFTQDQNVQNTLDGKTYYFAKDKESIEASFKNGRYSITQTIKEKTSVENKIYRGEINILKFNTDETDYQKISMSKTGKLKIDTKVLKNQNFSIDKNYSNKKLILSFKGSPVRYTLKRSGSNEKNHATVWDYIKQFFSNILTSFKDKVGSVADNIFKSLNPFK